MSLHEETLILMKAQKSASFLRFQINNGMIVLIFKKSCFRNILFNFFIGKYFGDYNKWCLKEKFYVFCEENINI